MAEHTHIEWTDATWNPITGCTLVSDGCKHCYAATLAATRLKHHPSRAGLARVNASGEAKFTGEVRLNEDWLDQPLRWRKPRRIFVCAHGDLFHESVPNEWIDRVFAVMALCQQHTFQVLTKRPERAREYLSERASEVRIDRLLRKTAPSTTWNGSIYTASRILEDGRPLPNVWLGTSIEDQATADARIPHLLATRASVRFVSAEPLLGPVDLTQPQFGDMHCAARCKGYCQARGCEECPDQYGLPKIDWLIVGGESGPHARPMHPDWVRSLRDQCQAAGVAFFFKQWGEWITASHDVCPDSDMSRNKAVWLGWDGRQAKPYHTGLDNPVGVIRVGKRAAGRLLDGREWNDMPGVSNG